MTLSQKDFDRIREMLNQTLENVIDIVDESPADQLCVLNLDWLKV